MSHPDEGFNEDERDFKVHLMKVSLQRCQSLARMSRRASTLTSSGQKTSETLRNLFVL